MEETNGTPVNKWTVLGVALLALLVTLFGISAVTNGTETIASELKADAGQAGWILKAYALAFAVLLLVAGKVDDLFGSQKTLLAGLVVLAAGSAAAGATSDPGWLIAFRAVQGAGAALVLPATLALILDAFPRRQRPTAFGGWIAATGVALGGGIALSGLAIDQLDWRWIFYGNAILAVLAGLFAFRFVPSVRRHPGGSIDLPGALTVTGGLAALGFAVLEGQGAGWSSPLVIALFVLAASQLSAFVLIERHQPDPLVSLGRFRNRNFGIGSLVAFLASAGILGSFFLIGLQLEQVLGYSALDTAAGLLPLVAVILVVAPLAGRLARRFDHRWLIASGLLLVTGALWWLGAVEATSTRIDLAMPLAVLGLGAALALPAVLNTVLSQASSNEYGTASGTFGTARNMGAVVGIAVAASVFVSQIETQVPKALADAAKDRQEDAGQTDAGTGQFDIKTAGTGEGAGQGIEGRVDLMRIDEKGAGLTGDREGPGPGGTFPRALDPLPVLGTVAQVKPAGPGGTLTPRQQEQQQREAEQQQREAREQAERQEFETESAIDEGLSKAAGNTFRYLSIFTLLGALATIYLGRLRQGRSGGTDQA